MQAGVACSRAVHWGWKQGDICCVSERIYLSLCSLACVWLWFGRTGTCCRCDGECCARGEERVMTVFNPSLWHRPAVHLTNTKKKKIKIRMNQIELLTLQPNTKTTTLGTQEADKRGVKYMHVGVKALEWMSGWTPRLCSHELGLENSFPPLLPCSTFSLTVLH